MLQSSVHQISFQQLRRHQDHTDYETYCVFAISPPASSLSSPRQLPFNNQFSVLIAADCGDVSIRILARLGPELLYSVTSGKDHRLAARRHRWVEVDPAVCLQVGICDVPLPFASVQAAVATAKGAMKNG